MRRETERRRCAPLTARCPTSLGRSWPAGLYESGQVKLSAMNIHKDDRAALGKLRKLVSDRSNIEQEIRATIDGLRAVDFDGYPRCSWGVIGDVLGVTKQSAQARYQRERKAR